MFNFEEAGSSIFRNYNTISNEYKNQIDKLVDIWKASIGESLKGVYLHGSMALNSFVEGVSDLDLLVVLRERLERYKRLEIAKRIIEIDKMPASIELSAICHKDLVPWKHPTPCQFHYSYAWTETYKKMLSREIIDNFIVDEDFIDYDIACHAKLTRQSGICLFGDPVNEVFPVIPESDFWESIAIDIDNYSFSAYGEQYYTSQILILGRVLSYKIEKRILSKYDAGLWILQRLPENLCYIVENALKSRYFGEKEIFYNPVDLESLRQLLIFEIKK